MARSKSKHRRVQHKIRLHWKKRKDAKKAAQPAQGRASPGGSGEAPAKKK
ncbi:MAG TPA: hypothetical protein VE618_10440 [Myxococcaceae bacterium]|jgi:hypothetical protein|nr:hypothetical protein [Myxococcaceae bacterium]HZA50370.1 hypothetical protein [Myxococcaceae bacterium]